MVKYAILSDLHGNLQALQAVLEDMKGFDLAGVILLGDLIDYGMQSNEVVDCIRGEFPYDVICSLWGNHERAILLSDFTRFSSQRGVDSAKYTAGQLREDTREYLDRALIREGLFAFTLEGKRCLAVHGSLEDPYWKAITPDRLRGDYANYDMVLSGHSHYSHMFTKFYDADDPVMRNKHAVTFINPGSVGQPRNHHPEAQYAVLDMQTMAVDMRSVPYDRAAAMAMYGDNVDLFYRDRLWTGV